MPRCCAFECSTTERDGKRLFRIPSAKRDATWRKAWLQRISRADFNPTQWFRLCEEEEEASAMAFARLASSLFLVFLATLGSGVGAEDDGPSVLRSMLAAFMKQGAQACGTVLPAIIAQTDRDGLVKKHNELRSKVAKGAGTLPKAANMRKLKWDDALAKRAQESADKCDPTKQETGDTLNTGSLTGVHQNVGSGDLAEDNADIMQFAEGILDKWFEAHTTIKATAVDNYVAQTDRQMESFAQLAWAETELVGCGFKHYKVTTVSKAILVCNYHPGLKPGAAIYKKGNPCSDCGGGLACDDMELCAKPSGDSSATSQPKAEEGGFSFLAIVGILGALAAVGAIVAGVIVMRKSHAAAASAAAALPGGAEEGMGGSREAAGGDAVGDAAGPDELKAEAGAEGEKAAEAPDAPAASQDALTKH
ncbi:cysteine-rich venom protein-like [Dermacentor andersoni]|uniref:cysteine-rich venom protein-like n=1 Tax=Dermacentor andersoni TaxID=34620 RepID=UPI0021559597|nr:cysteine-rich venom protein-like [Dermacentor andersoni]